MRPRCEETLVLQRRGEGTGWINNEVTGRRAAAKQKSELLRAGYKQVTPEGVTAAFGRHARPRPISSRNHQTARPTIYEMASILPGGDSAIDWDLLRE